MLPGIRRSLRPAPTEAIRYPSPVTEFTSQNLSLPNQQDEDRFRDRRQKITVITGRAVEMDFRLERGAAIDGSVLHDDGSL